MTASRAAVPVEALVDRVLSLRAAVGPGRPVVVGVVGEPGSGKSTLTASVVTSLTARGVTAVVVPMDGFHLANVALAALGRADRKGALDTFDGAGYAALLARVRAGGPDTVWAPTYDRSLEESVAGAVAVVPGTEVVVTEGNYLLVDEPPWDGIRGLLDEAWFLEPDEDVRRARLVARHERHGRSHAEAVARADGIDAANARVIAGTAHRADVVLRATAERRHDA
jgi:pantothenate kinase